MIALRSKLAYLACPAAMGAPPHFRSDPHHWRLVPDLTGPFLHRPDAWEPTTRVGEADLIPYELRIANLCNGPQQHRESRAHAGYLYPMLARPETSPIRFRTGAKRLVSGSQGLSWVRPVPMAAVFNEGWEHAQVRTAKAVS